MRKGIMSGYKWYAELPDDWEERKLQYSSRIYSGGTPDRSNLDYWEGGTIPWLTSGEINKKVITYSDNFITELAVKHSSTQWVKAGAILMAMNGQGKTKATVALLEFNSTINQSLCSINLKKDHDRRFVFYFLEGQYNQIRGLVGEDREGLNLSLIKSIVLPLPPLTTQNKIANFLDKETDRIDTLINKKQKQIELLNEKRQAIITQAVTKGLNEDVKMKESGVEWIGQIPEHWEVLQCKYGFDIKLGKMIQNEPQSDIDEFVPYLKAINVNWLKVDTETENKMWATPKQIKNYNVIVGDLLVCEGGEVGRSCIVEEIPENCIIQNALHRVRSTHKANNKFLYYFLIHASTANWLNIICNKATISHFTYEKFGRMEIALPPKEEQLIILNKLDSEMFQIQDLTKKIEKSINLLKEYRSSLITHAVSGQIDIPINEVSK